MGLRDDLQLLKYLRQMKIRFNPFDNSSGSTRMLMVPLTTEKIAKINDKFQVQTDVGTHIKFPGVSVTYSDGKTMDLDASKLSVIDLETMIFKYAKILKSKEDSDR